MKPIEVTIVGAGIGGLCLAIAVRQRGARASVLEQAPAMEAVGSGLTLGPQALGALDRLGVGDSVRDRSGSSQRWINLTAGGRVLSVKPWHGAAIHRADLQAVLLEAAGGWDCVHLASRVVGFRQNASGIAAMLDGGRAWHGDVLVGADGLHSGIREQLFGDGHPRPVGMVALRGVATFSVLESTNITETWGRGRRFGLQPIGSDRVYWYATSNRWFDAFRDPSSAKAWMLASFAGWHTPIEGVIEATPPEEILVTEICDRAPLSRWASGRVTLLGDAAHAMTPDLGIGAAEAMQDALVLAACLSEHGPLEGIRAYERRRIRKANALIRRARRVTRIRQVENPVLCEIRDLAARLGRSARGNRIRFREKGKENTDDHRRQ